jgi:serine/threonine-protein kinase ULK/ATG1
VKKIKNYIYDPAQIIGSGFSSNVYKGLNELNGETIAIKVLELSKIQSEVEKYLLNN